MPYIDDFGGEWVTASNISTGTLTANHIGVLDEIVLNIPNPEETTVKCNRYKYKLVRDDCSEED